MCQATIDFIRELYGRKDFIPLHEPIFNGNEKKYLNNCIDSTFVSSVGKYVDYFEEMVVDFTGAKFAVATVNGTAALHIGLLLSDVKRDDEVITQPLTFVATCNAISYIGAHPLFIDVDKNTLSLSPEKLLTFLQTNTEQVDGRCKNKLTGRLIKAMVPMHTFGHPGRIKEIAKIANDFNIELVEDAAESLGSYYDGIHTGLFGKMGTLSFNGNKTITTGGGGMLVTNDEGLAKRAKHLTTTAKIPHKWEFDHDTIGFNYRLPNINAALGCAQMERLTSIIENKRETAKKYQTFFSAMEEVSFVVEPKNARSNYWLNAIILKDRKERDSFLEQTNRNGVMTRPVWKLMNHLDMFKNTLPTDLENAQWLEDRIVNIPSSAVI
ncbi:LegC family aminotransferase [Muricauda oceani]|uniref:GDP-perosamine synthase n=1 Tax=Flagellimonas oceani TaxID=2698672 RepID=A0A6G7J6R8_9FLAO|nr:LegC family aminotransferase [Allomuricauda oceani]MBW8242634.1 LegC family aminotransferase [Allomuricauda oceani]QII46390.1 LegC family aminotransferase [Allomuricauda oceani]